MLVGSRNGGGGGKSLREKHAEDIWTLVGTIRNHQAVPRVLLRSGKKSKATLEQSQERVRSAQQCSQDFRSAESACEAIVSASVASAIGITADGVRASTSPAESDGSLIESIVVSGSSSSVGSIDSTFKSTILRDINLLRNSITEIQPQLHVYRVNTAGPTTRRPRPEPRSCLFMCVFTHLIAHSSVHYV